MNRFASVTVAASLLAAACTTGAWQGWGLVQRADEDRLAVKEGRQQETVQGGGALPMQYAAYGDSGTDIQNGYYGWSYLFASPAGAPLVAAQKAVRDD